MSRSPHQISPLRSALRLQLIQVWLWTLLGSMSMKKAFDQTIRDLKREVNKKVLKVPSIEQKVLDATSNEPWGPHGSLLADIAQATRNYHEYQMIMAVIWKRVNDTGKNWRHVYKALTVLEYLVAHGSERVIDEIREHAYQISTLSDFQYIDSSGRDQGNNVRRKSQSLVLIVNDKERIQEVRQKAAANKDKFRNTSAMGGMYRPGSYSSSGGYGDRYDDDYYHNGRYGSKDEERTGYGREREWGYRDEDRYGRYGDSYSGDGDHYNRDSEERYGRDSYRDDAYHGTSRGFDDNRHGSRGRSSDRERHRSFDDDDRHSSRGSSVKAEDHPQEERRLERKFSEQNLGAPPSYEEAVAGSRSPAYSERDGETPAAPAPKSSSPPASSNPSLATVDPVGSLSHQNQKADAFDEFDPRGSVSAAPHTSSNAEIDLLGSLSDSVLPNPLAIMPVSSSTAASGFNTAQTSGLTPAFVATNSTLNAENQSFEDPFGDSPFKATPSLDEVPTQAQTFAYKSSSQPAMNNVEQAGQGVQKVDTFSNTEFADTFMGSTFNPTNDQNFQLSLITPQFAPQEQPPFQNDDILAGILPPSGPMAPTPTASQPAFFAAGSQPPPQATFLPPTQPPPPPAFLPTTTQTAPIANVQGFIPQSGPTAAVVPSMAPQNLAMPTAQHDSGNSSPLQAASSLSPQMPMGTVTHQNDYFMGNLISQGGPTMSMSSQQAHSFSTGSLSTASQLPPKDKFEPKSTVWADTLSRGLVNLNISGPKINPLADIGIDFESLNRKEKRMEKPASAPVTSNVTMGKAMGSGSGIGRAGVSALRPPQNPMIGSHMGMGMGRGPTGPMVMGMGMGGMGPNMGMGVYGGMNQPMGMGMGGMGQVAQMQTMNPMPQASNMASGYNPMMGGGGGGGGYTPQPPYGGGYR
ncbi:hypothetical protein Nepgr_028420 [Nepenthes gracilis]|uniref:ENTH domain-containing protein n=1 Tax=Nepenthes gracilis TaxID=150966 RepID=A0AAD3Y237_NEPGR|nr:hypothetical protein Nepgr_028420 [Nepenthes gracilis]